MNEINFLSDDFLRELGRKQRLFREGVLIGIVTLALASWGVIGWRGVSSLEAQLVVAQQEAEDLTGQAAQYANLSQQHASLQHQMNIQRELTLPLNFTPVIATISELMPASLTVEELKVTATKPTPRPKIDPAKAKAAAAAGATKKKRKIVVPVMRISITGVSPTDGEVADFVDKLTQHPVFGSVDLHYTRPDRVSVYSARKFSIDLEIPLDRLYEPRNEESEHQEMAHAS